MSLKLGTAIWKNVTNSIVLAASGLAHTFKQNTLPSPIPLIYITGLAPVNIFTM